MWHAHSVQCTGWENPWLRPFNGSNPVSELYSGSTQSLTHYFRLAHTILSSSVSNPLSHLALFLLMCKFQQPTRRLYDAGFSCDPIVSRRCKESCRAASDTKSDVCLFCSDCGQCPFNHFHLCKMCATCFACNANHNHKWANIGKCVCANQASRSDVGSQLSPILILSDDESWLFSGFLWYFEGSDLLVGGFRTPCVVYSLRLLSKSHLHLTHS